MDKEFLKYLRTQQKKHGVTWEDKSYRDQKIEMEHKKETQVFLLLILISILYGVQEQLNTVLITWQKKRKINNGIFRYK